MGKMLIFGSLSTFNKGINIDNKRIKMRRDVQKV